MKRKYRSARALLLISLLSFNTFSSCVSTTRQGFDCSLGGAKRWWNRSSTMTKGGVVAAGAAGTALFVTGLTYGVTAFSGGIPNFSDPLSNTTSLNNNTLFDGIDQYGSNATSISSQGLPDNVTMIGDKLNDANSTFTKAMHNPLFGGNSSANEPEV